MTQGEQDSNKIYWSPFELMVSAEEVRLPVRSARLATTAINSAGFVLRARRRNTDLHLSL
jgi:hypothetical protein